MVLPLVSVMDAVRRSHWISSYGEISELEKRRGNSSPGSDQGVMKR